MGLVYLLIVRPCVKRSWVFLPGGRSESWTSALLQSVSETFEFITRRSFQHVVVIIDCMRSELKMGGYHVIWIWRTEQFNDDDS